MELTPEEIKVLGISAPAIMRLLKLKEEGIVTRMYGEFRNGKTDQLTSVAEIACLRDLAHTIKSALGRLEEQGDQ